MITRNGTDMLDAYNQLNKDLGDYCDARRAFEKSGYDLNALVEFLAAADKLQISATFISGEIRLDCLGIPVDKPVTLEELLGGEE